MRDIAPVIYKNT